MDYDLKDLVDINKLQSLTDRLYETANITTAIVANDGEILTKSGWKRICTDFHRKHPVLGKECTQRDLRVFRDMEEGDPFSIYTCPRGLIDASIPIVIEGVQVASAFVGQLFLEQPDQETEQFFRKQARKFGLDEKAYMEAYEEIPVIPVESFRVSLVFLAELAQMIGEMGLQRLKELNSKGKLLVSEANYRTLAEKYANLLRQSQSITESTMDGFWMMDMEGNCLEVNQAFADMLGFTKEELKGMKVSDIDDVENPEETKQHMEKVIREGIDRFETRHKCRDGRSIDVEISATFLRDQKIFTVFSRDITKRKRVQEQLEQSEERYRSLFNNINEGVALHEAVFDEQGKMIDFVFLDCNPTCEKIANLKRDEVIGKRGTEVIPNLDPEWIDSLGKVVQTGEPATIVKYSQFMDKYIHMNAYIMNRPQFAVTFTDVTERFKNEEKLRIYNRRWVQAQKVARIGNWELDVATQAIWGSKEAFFIYGIPFDPDENPDQILSMEEVVACAPEGERVKQALEDLISEGIPINLEFEVIRKDNGASQFVHAKADMKNDELGNPLKGIGTVQDISERIQREQALAESEEKFRSLFEKSPMGLAYHRLICDESGKAVDYSFLDVNERFIDLAGTDPKGKRVTEAFPGIEKDPFDWIGKFERVGKYGENIRFQQFFQINNRHYDIVAFQSSPDHFVAAFIEITEQKKAQEAIQTIFNISTDLICIADNNSANYLQVNPAFERLLGYTETEMVGKSFYEFIHPDDIAASQEMVEKGLVGGKSVIHFQNRIRRTDGDYVWIDWISEPFVEKGITYAIGRDVTKAKKMEEQRAQLEEQFRQSQKMESIGRLAGGVAHDFNNILTGINGYTEMILDGLNPDDPMHEDMKEIKIAGERAASLTAQLLAFSRKQIISPKILQPNEIIDQSQRMLTRIIGEDIDLKFFPGQNLGRIKADPAQLDQIFFKLAINSRDAMPDGGKLTIETENVTIDEEYCDSHVEAEPGEFVMLAVSDTGVGMDSETKANIFEPFFSTKEKDQGTGLGLATVYGIMKQNNGFISVYSEVDVGTTFKVYFPRIADNADIVKQKKISDMPAGTETVLLVEDEDMVRGLAKRVLERQGYKVIATESGEAAISYYDTHDEKIDLLLTDVIMPGMNGRKLYENLKEIQPDLNVLFMSGYTENVIAQQGILEDGMNFIQKPYTIDVLAEKVREVLDDDD